MAKAECGVWFSLGMPFGNYQHFWFNNSFDNPKQTLIYEPFKPDWGGVHVHTSLPEGVPGDQDANRARNQLKAFAAERGLSFAAWYVENESGAKLARPELFRLLADGQPGDVLLVEQVDRLSRLTSADWEKLKAELTMRRVRVVALDLQTSWMMVTGNADEFAGRMFEAINGMLLDMLAAVARKDYDDRRRRQAQGQAKAMAEGRYKGRPEDTERNAGIASMLTAGQSWSFIQDMTGCSRATVAKIAKRIDARITTDSHVH